MKGIRYAAFAALIYSVMSSSFAVTASQLPGAVFPDQVRKSLHPSDDIDKPLKPVAATTPSEKSIVGEAGKKIVFTLNQIILEDNKVYSTKELLPLYQNQLHKTISVSDLFGIAEKITRFYRNNGYILTRALIPKQRVKNGVVRIQVIEGFAYKINVQGHPHGTEKIMRVYGQKIADVKPLRLDHLEHYALIANDVPFTQMRIIFSPSKKKLGGADMSMIVENEPISGYVSYDNYGTRYIGPQQMTANLGLNSWVASGDSTQLTVVKTPKGQELTYTDASYSMPVGGEGMRWLLGITRTKTHPLFVLEPAQIDGLSYNYYTSVQYPLIRSRGRNLILQASFNILDSSVTTLEQPLYTDRLRSLEVGAAYNFADRFYGFNLITAGLRKGLPIMGYSSDTDMNTALTSRPGGRGDYTKVNLYVSRLQSISSALSLFGVIRGQWAFQSLLSSEQFSFGGSQNGRGYDVAEIIGDRGAAASLELRYDLEVERFKMKNLQLYTFYDLGKIWNYEQISSTEKIQSAASAGLGARFYFTKYVSGNFMYAKPLTKSVTAEEFVHKGRSPRVLFSVVAALN